MYAHHRQVPGSQPSETLNISSTTVNKQYLEEALAGNITLSEVPGGKKTNFKFAHLVK